MIDATDDKLNFDDLSFDDMIDEGIKPGASEEVVAEEPVTNEIEAAPVGDVKEAADTLDEDAEKKEEETVPEAHLVEEKETKVESQPQENIEGNIEGGVEGDSTVVSEVMSNLGFDLGDDTYDDNVDGLTKLTKDVGDKIAQEHMKELFEEFPLVKEHLEYVIAGGQSQNFMQAYDPKLDFARIKLSDKDTATQKMLVSKYFKEKGHDEGFVNELIEDYEDGGKLMSKAQLAQKALVNSQKVERAKLVQQQKQEHQQQRQQQKKFWDDVYETIDTSKEFSGIVIPQNEKNKFFKYLTTPVRGDGTTKRDIDHTESSIQTKLAIDYLMFKGFKLDDVIKNKVKTSKAKDLRSRITTNESRTKSAKRSSRRNTGFDIEDLDLSVI
mgnify:CR=1 FL=1|tara:strand:- start:720 stop:1868 length:1149 start_codon:yes stop_codon:yes gene_type:complete